MLRRDCAPPSELRPYAVSTRFLILALLLCVGFALPILADEPSEAKILLYPDIHRDFVVFVHGEDIWRAPSDGGVAYRLTSHPGEELFPKISPDGAWIAFSAQYSGSRQVWVMPSEGGTPKQLTFYTDVGEMPPRGGFDYWILGWTPDGKILVRANRTPWGERMGRYYVVDPEGGLETPLPVPHGGTATLSADGTSLAYTPIDREFRTWKHSRGGRAQDLWIYDLAAEKSTRLTDFRGTDNFPMWASDDTIYFTSDRDYTLELFALERDGSGTWSPRQVTKSEGDEGEAWDLLWPSYGPDPSPNGAPEDIVFSRAGELWKMSLADESVTQIPVRIAGAHQHLVPYFEDASDDVSSATLSPSAQRVIFAARGDLFSVPAENGPTRNLTQTQGVRELSPSWSPDGRWLAYLSDVSGEYELYLMRNGEEGFGEPRRLTTGGDIWKYEAVWSPESDRLAWADRARNLWIVEASGGDPVLVDRGFRGDLDNYSFSPDGKWLVYERVREDTRLGGISLYSLDTGKVHRLGDGQTADGSPAFSHDGKYLFFTSDRDFNLRFSSLEFDFLADRSARVYVASLDPSAPALFPPRSDEETPAAEDDESDGTSDDTEKSDKGSDEENGDEAEDSSVVVEPGGFAARTVALPGVEPGGYAGLQAADGALFFVGFGDGPPTLHRYDLEKRKLETVLEGAGGYELSSDGKKILLRRRGAWHVVDARAGADANGGKLDLAGVQLKVDPRKEWAQIFEDGWRIARDFFYDPNMHGMDWQGIGERYRSLVPYVSDRSELDFLFGELIGELAAGHTYVGGGDHDDVDRVTGGMLGAEFVADGDRYRIERIFEGENWHEGYRSPLTEAGVDVSEGDYLLAIDGEELTTSDNPFRLLEGKADQQVRLTVSSSPTSEGARHVTVETISSELNLRYIDWVKSRQRLVEELSGGRVGYIHLPDTAFDGNRMLQKMFYAQSSKEALIVDDRFNGGGFIPDTMIEYLSRTRMAYWDMREIDSMRTPGFFHDGPKIMLMNGYSSSGGDALPYFFRQKGLGPLVGTRTWGGLIGITGGPQLADGGAVTVCTFRIYDENGEWVVENEGVVPDVEVFDTPEGLKSGDPSIEKAVEMLLQELEEEPTVHPEPPEPPDLSRSAHSSR
ncbi:MAG: PDZ domain-containing protein [Thermoanaerobaculia bacterium]|nr:PDZ domain-containing protein [Thermoanaerobaculia bacterium]